MTDRPQRPTDPDAVDPTTDDLVVDETLEGDEAIEGEVETETLSEELEAMGVEPVADEELTEEEAEAEEAAVAAGVPPVEARAQTTGRRIGLRRTSRVLTPSELAVHINEPWSRIFVLATVGVFALILLNALLLGRGGLITGTPTPAPSASASAAPSPGASDSPAVSASASASAGASASASPPASASASAPAGASPSASAAPSASASAASSGSPAASPVPSQ